MYHPFLKYLHASLIVLIAIQFLTAWTMPGLRGASSPALLVTFHFSFGLVELVIAVFLILARVVLGRPAPVASSSLQHALATFMHIALYALVIVVPLTGYAWASSRGLPVSLFFIANLPSIGNSA